MQLPSLFSGAPLKSLLAYIGPGADLALIGSVIGLLFTLGSSMLFMVLWPFRSLWRKLRNTADAPKEETAAANPQA